MAIKISADQLLQLLRTACHMSDKDIRIFIPEAQAYLESFSSNPLFQYDFGPPLYKSIPSAKTQAILQSLINSGLDPEAINELFPEVQMKLNRTVAKFTEKLFEDHGITPYAVNRDFEAIHDSYIREVINGKNCFSHEYLYALCFYFELSDDEIKEFMEADGIEFDGRISDKVFQMFMKSGMVKKKNLKEYVKQCMVMAEQSGEKISSFFHNSNWGLL